MRDTIDMAREAGDDWDSTLSTDKEFLKRFEALVRADERAAPVQDENQAFIDSLPTDSDDKMYMQIHHWARQSYARHKSLVAGQMITAGDASDTHIIWATLRWAKENTPPAPAPVPDFKSFKEWAAGEGYDVAYTHDGIKWVCLNPMTADLWCAWQAAHGITEKGGAA
jgi:hypothetical protein